MKQRIGMAVVEDSNTILKAIAGIELGLHGRNVEPIGNEEEVVG